MELSSYSVEKSLMFSQKKAFLIFCEMEIQKTYISRSNVPGSKN